MSARKRKKGPLYLLVIRHHGQPHGVRVSFPYLLALAIFLSAFFFLSLVVFYRYAVLSREKGELLEKNAALGQEVARYRQQVQTAKQYQELIAQLNHKDRKNSPASETEAGSGRTQRLPETPQAPLTVSGLALTPDRRGRSLRFSFQLALAGRPANPISGRLVVLFHNPDRAGSEEVPYPASIKMADGRPSNPEQGLRFTVRRSSTIRGQAPGVSDPEGYTEVTVLAYSEGGELLMNSSLPAGTKTAAP